MTAGTAHAQTHYSAPTESVGVTSSSQSVTVPIVTTGTLSSINVLMQGSPSLDYSYVSGGTCTIGNNYNSGQSCTVNYAFTPKHPGMRNGGITLTNSSGTVLGTVYLSGLGNGPQPDFTTGTGNASIQL
jgi:hypothetical protein